MSHDRERVGYREKTHIENYRICSCVLWQQALLLRVRDLPCLFEQPHLVPFDVGFLAPV